MFIPVYIQNFLLTIYPIRKAKKVNPTFEYLVDIERNSSVIETRMFRVLHILIRLIRHRVNFCLVSSLYILIRHLLHNAVTHAHALASIRCGNQTVKNSRP